MRSALSVVNELKADKLKVRGIIVSGGEPLMHPHLREILESVRPVTNEIVLATNGTLVNSSNVVWITELIDAVTLSFDSNDAAKFAEFRGQSNVLNRVDNALRLFTQHGVQVIAQTTLSKYNVDLLDSMALFLISRGASSWIVRTPLRIGRAKLNEQHFLTHSEARAKQPLFENIRERYASHFDVLTIGNRFQWSYDTEFSSTKHKPGFATCAAGIALATIRPDGTMVPCAIFGDTTSREIHSPPVWAGRFLSEWRNSKSFKTMRSIKLEAISPCGRCSKLPDVCDGGCRALGFHAFGTVYGPDPDCNYVRSFCGGVFAE